MRRHRRAHQILRSAVTQNSRKTVEYNTSDERATTNALHPLVSARAQAYAEHGEHTEGGGHESKLALETRATAATHGSVKIASFLLHAAAVRVGTKYSAKPSSAEPFHNHKF